MTLARLLAAALVICSVPAFAQDQVQNSQASTTPCRESWTGCPVQGNVLGNKNLFSLDRTTAATPAEPWRLIPSEPANLRSEQNPLDPARLEHVHLDQIKGNPHVRQFKLDLRPETLAVNSNVLETDNTCYAIRSYVVARDSKASDSTHPVSYSTCQPSNRYQLRTTEIRVEAGDH